VPSFDTAGFEPAFAVDIEPEFPGDGEWHCPVVGFDRDGGVMPEFDSRCGTPFVVRMRPWLANAWIAMFAAGVAPFDNDDAADWATGFDGVDRSVGLQILRNALAAVDTTEYLEASGGAVAVAAAQVGRVRSPDSELAELWAGACRHRRRLTCTSPSLPWRPAS
jgi:hypothetical protein